MASARAKVKKAKPPRPPWVRWVKRSLALLLLLGVIGVCVGFAFFLREYMEAERMVDDLEDRLSKTFSKPSEIVSADGKVLFTIAAEYRKPIASLDDVPQKVRQAILAAEDKRFYEHSGVDAMGLARAAFLAAQNRRFTQGGSTLTMQLAKRLYSGSEKTFDRKLQDITIAQAIERRKTKDQILLLYMNEVYFGEGAWGLGAAAEVYFAKNLDQLTVGEAAILARCVRRPSQDSPMNNLPRAIRNREIVLKTMLEEGWITQSQYESGNAERVQLNPDSRQRARMLAPYFVSAVMQEVEEKFPNIDLHRGGYRIETTLDYGIQQVAEREVARVVRENRSRRVTTGAFVLADRNGRILAEVGGVNFRRNQFNMISQGKRQPGSAFKPFMYAVALQKGVIQPNSMLSNEAIKFPDPSRPTGYWEPKNNGRRGAGGQIGFTTAFAGSVNLPAIHTILETGPGIVAQVAKDSFGFRSPLDPYAPLALGASAVNPLELVEGYSTFMLRGDRVRPTSITRITAPDGSLLLDQPPVIFRRVFPAEHASAIDAAMRVVVTGGTGRVALAIPNARGKTGTTNDGRDAWFCGYADGLVGVAWIANEQLAPGKPARYLPMPNVFGGTTSIQIWTSVMRVAHRKYGKPLEFADQEPEPPVEPLREGQEPSAVVPPPTMPPGWVDGQPAPAVNDDTAPETEPRPTTPTKAPTPEPKVAENVEVEICADSRQKATIYCPETVTQRYRKGQEPKRSCPIHQPPG